MKKFYLIVLVVNNYINYLLRDTTKRSNRRISASISAGIRFYGNAIRDLSAVVRRTKEDTHYAIRDTRYELRDTII